MLKAFIHIKVTEQHKYNSNIFSDSGLIISCISWEHPKVCVNLQTDVR